MQRHFQTKALGAKKRQRTRACLLDSAAEIFARVGVNDAKISDITMQAGLANGTFYNHFEDKNALVLETATAITLEITREINNAMIDIDDAVIRIVVASHSFLSLAVEYKNWGSVLVDAFHFLPKLRMEAAQYLNADIQRGLDQGKFDLALDPFILKQIGALLLQSMQDQIEDGLDIKLLDRTCENILRLLGLTPSKASLAVKKSQAFLFSR